MPRPSRALSIRVALALAAVVCTGALAGCNQPPALAKAELDAGKMPKKHPKVAAELGSSCRNCHREQPPIRK